MALSCLVLLLLLLQRLAVVTRAFRGVAHGPRCDAGQQRATKQTTKPFGPVVVAAAAPLEATTPGQDLLKNDDDSEEGERRATWRELTPAGPFNRPIRRTLRRVLVPDEIWSLEQVQGAIFVHVPVRCVVVKLRCGELLCYGAVAPTLEMLDLLADLESRHGPVTHIVLPTTATEHKLFAIALARRKRKATLWIAPSQFSFPLNVPNDLLGFPASRTRLLKDTVVAPWCNDLSFTRLGPFFSMDGVANFEEIVCYHAKTRSLLCCDLLVSVPAEPPEILDVNDPRAIDFHARATADVPTDRIDGWRKICLFALYFQSSPLKVASEPDGTLGGAFDFFRTAFPSNNAKPDLGWRNFFAWSWPDKNAVDAAFDALSQDGALLVPPILAVSILNRRLDDLRDFVENDLADIGADRVARVVPCHFDAPVNADLGDIKAALKAAGLYNVKNSPGGKPMSSESSSSSSNALLRGFEDFITKTTKTRDNNKSPPRRSSPLPDADLAFLRDFETSLVESGTIAPRPTP